MAAEPGIVARPMESSTYTASSRVQSSGIASGIKFLAQAAADVALPPAGRPLGIADYGAANGHNSLPPLDAAIAALRTRTDESILVTHTDLPDNDFTALFGTLNDSPDSYLKKHRDTYAAAVGRSFYQQILPSESITLGWSSWATHWLSRVPGPIPDHIHAAHTADDAVRDAYSRQSAQDWHNFLAGRARELAPGGRLVVLVVSFDSAGNPSFSGVMQTLMESLQALADTGRLRPAELDRMVVPTLGRSRSQLLAPFSPTGVFEGLSVEHLELLDVEDMFWARYQDDGDAAALGSAWTGFARAAIFPTLTTALDDSAGSAQFIDDLAAELATRIAAAPQRNSIPLAALIVGKS